MRTGMYVQFIHSYVPSMYNSALHVVGAQKIFAEPKK